MAREPDASGKFAHYACLYIKYLQMLGKLDTCYDCMIHPQKRIAVKKVLELVIVRLVELKHVLVKCNPPHHLLKMNDSGGHEKAFPWEYVHLDEVLVDLKLSPDILEVPIPKYFKEDNAKQLEQRDRMLFGYMRLKHNTDNLYLEDDAENVTSEKMSLDKAIEIIQRNERGRQGLYRVKTQRDIRDREKQSRMYDSKETENDIEPDVAGTNIQRLFRGFQARVAAHQERDNELMFVGMRARKDNVELLNYDKNIAYHKRKQEQYENKLSYEKALEDLKSVIMEEEGPEKKEELREERTLWITDQNKARKNTGFILNASTGMVGVPQVTESGVVVRAMINSAIQIGGEITIQSTVNPAANGTFKVLKMDAEEGFEPSRHKGGAL